MAGNPFNNSYEAVTLDQWVKSHPSEEDMREVFLNMDRALKYIHDHGYCIYQFHPSQIEVLENSADHINFRKLMELSSNPTKRKDMIREDIFNSSLIQLSFYGGINAEKLFLFNPSFVKGHFEEFVQFIPNGDVPYYRGVIQRGASVYFCEYAVEKRNRDLMALEEQLEGEKGVKNLTKSIDYNVDNGVMTNDKINDNIYKQINGLKDAAFVNLLLVPTIALVVILIFSVMAWVMSLS